MKRIAILGSDSTHTGAYAAVIRSEAFRSQICIDSIWGTDSAATRLKAASLGIPRVGATPEEAPAVYQARSALYWPELINTPLLLLHGEADWSGTPSRARIRRSRRSIASASGCDS